MQTDLENDLAQMKAVWMMGGSAQSRAPQSWRTVADESPSAELALLALAGQAIDICFASAPSKLTTRPDIPPLPLPTLPEAFRSNFRRVLPHLSNNTEQEAAFIRLVANRGYGAHPMDWMPTASASVPDVYAVWQDWRLNGAITEKGETLKLEDWDAWMPAERLVALKSMRQHDPEAALAIITQKSLAEPAEKRFEIVDALSIGLSENDAAFLQSLSTDRSKKVKTRAQQLLARLGQSENDSDASTELAEFLDVSKAGFLSRKNQLKAKKLKTKTQYKRRAELFEIVSISNLSQALNLTVSDIIELWTPEQSDIEATTEFIKMVIDTAPDSAVSRLAERLRSQTELSAASLARLYTRLKGPQRAEMMRELLKRPNDYFASAVACAEDTLGTIPYDALQNTLGYKSFLGDLKKLAKDDDNRQSNFTVDRYLTNISLLCDQNAAKSLLETCRKLDLPVSTHRFALLAFNAALTQHLDDRKPPHEQ